MNMQSTSTSCDFSQIFWVSKPICPCKKRLKFSPLDGFSSRMKLYMTHKRKRYVLGACMISSNDGNHNLDVEFANSATRVAKSFVANRLSNELDERDLSRDSVSTGTSNFASFEEDPIVGKLRTQLGVVHPLPSPPVNKNIVGFFVFFFFVGVVFDKLWTSRKKNKSSNEGRLGIWPQVPTSLSSFLEKDLQRKESVEWVNMVLSKLWKVYKPGLENWLIGLLQPVIDDLKKPDYVERVEIKQFSLGDEPLSVRNVERKTSRRVNDLQYQIGLRYTGGARMLLMLSLKFGIVPIAVPVGIRDFDIDGELWVKLRLIPTEPWVGAAQWAFVSLPKIKFELSPFRLFNLMAIPVLSMFLTKLLTEDLPRLFVRPKKIVLDFQKGKAVGPLPTDFKSGEVQEGNRDFVGELSVTLVDARKLSYAFFGKTDPYVILRLGDQVIHSKKNSQTTVIGPPGEPIWNQDFSMLVANPRKEKMYIQVNDSLGFADLSIGTAEVDLGSLKDTVPTDRIVALQGGWGLFGKGSAGELLLRLTYKAYVDDEEDEVIGKRSTDTDASDDELSESEENNATYVQPKKNLPSGTETFMDVLAALIVSEEFQGIVASETVDTKSPDNVMSKKSTLRSVGPNVESVPSNSGRDSEKSRGSALFWLSLITSISVLIALNMGGFSLFNP
ncbi:Calcium-dependent lipid-binding family protein [Heracleum sosnowskyi]|uniref:Calcium-dependent lipid-binding family protein n=1 Tax=Heracleum sosnowskyi TaxID=360622 RepID=A0AAD8MPX1_9APIA|nr:Calcium-dependent lipid-binding family protein [Heracleum sosnowskyi]